MMSRYRRPTPKMVQERAKLIYEHLDAAPIVLTPCAEESELLKFLKENLFSREQRVWLFGYTDFKNTGDQALWLALNRVIETLTLSGAPGRLVHHPETIRKLDQPQNLVIFPGGGSLGNRYNSSKRRIEFLEANPTFQFIQMPVSTSFGEDGAFLERLRTTYSRGGSKVFVRDSTSKREAEHEIGLMASMVPDLVEFLPSCEDFASKDFGTLYLYRTDQESTGAADAVDGRDLLTCDWQDFIIREHLGLKIQKKIFSGLSRLSRSSGLFNYHDAASKRRYKIARELSLNDTSMALAYLSFFEKVVR